MDNILMDNKLIPVEEVKDDKLEDVNDRARLIRLQNMIASPNCPVTDDGDWAGFTEIAAIEKRIHLRLSE